LWWRLLFWLAWRLPVRAEAVVVAADPDRGLRIRNPEPLAGRHPQDAEAPACGAVLAGTDLPGRKRCALIADADQSRGRDGAGVAVLVPTGGQEAVTAEVRDLASAGQAELAPGEGMDPGEVEVSILARAEVKRGILVAARHLALVEEAGLVRVEARVLAAAWNLASAADVDSAPVPDRTEARTLVEAGGQVKMDQAEVRDLVAVRARALAGRVAGSARTDAPMSTCPARPSRNRKFRQKRRRVLRNLDRPKKMLPSKRVFPNNDGSR